MTTSPATETAIGQSGYCCPFSQTKTISEQPPHPMSSSRGPQRQPDVDLRRRQGPGKPRIEQICRIELASLPPKPKDGRNQSKNLSQGQSDLAWFTKVWARVCYFGRNSAKLSSSVTPAKAAASQSAAGRTRALCGVERPVPTEKSNKHCSDDTKLETLPPSFCPAFSPARSH